MSVRATLGTGAPFLFPAGSYSLLRYDPTHYVNLGVSTFKRLSETQAGRVTLWSSVQGRVPLYARCDVSLRYALRWGSWHVTPYASVVNVADRPNVLSYAYVGGGLRPDEHQLIPQTQLPLFPFVGIDFRFR